MEMINGKRKVIEFRQGYHCERGQELFTPAISIASPVDDSYSLVHLRYKVHATDSIGWRTRVSAKICFDKETLEYTFTMFDVVWKINFSKRYKNMLERADTTLADFIETTSFSRDRRRKTSCIESITLVNKGRLVKPGFTVSPEFSWDKKKNVIPVSEYWGTHMINESMIEYNASDFYGLDIGYGGDVTTGIVDKDQTHIAISADGQVSFKDCDVFTPGTFVDYRGLPPEMDIIPVASARYFPQGMYGWVQEQNEDYGVTPESTVAKQVLTSKKVAAYEEQLGHDYVIPTALELNDGTNYNLSVVDFDNGKEITPGDIVFISNEYINDIGSGPQIPYIFGKWVYATALGMVDESNKLSVNAFITEKDGFIVDKRYYTVDATHAIKVRDARYDEQEDLKKDDLAFLKTTFGGECETVVITDVLNRNTYKIAYIDYIENYMENGEGEIVVPGDRLSKIIPEDYLMVEPTEMTDINYTTTIVDTLSSATEQEQETSNPTEEDQLVNTVADIAGNVGRIWAEEALLMGENEHDYESMVVQHPKYETIKTCIKNNIALYLAGPAGSGKNYTVESIAEELGYDFYFANSIQDEFKLIGYSDAGGKYHETEFYKACTSDNNSIFFLDEMDASDEEVLVILNAAIANGYFAFPNGKDKVYLNKVNFIAAGNTLGNGADDMYTARRQLDSATLDRFAIVEFDYDENVEYKLAKGNQELLDFVRDLRSSSIRNGIRAVFSYRCIEMATKLLDTHLSLEEIIKIAIVKGLDEETLRTFDIEKNKTYFHRVFYDSIVKI